MSRELKTCMRLVRSNLSQVGCLCRNRTPAPRRATASRETKESLPRAQPSIIFWYTGLMTQAIFVTRSIPGPALETLKAKGYDVTVRDSEIAPTEDELIALLSAKPYDAVLTLLTDPITARVMDAAPSVKLYANYAVGFDNIDIDTARERGIIVTNTAGDYSYTVAEHTLALMLALTTRMVEADASVRRGEFTGWSPTHFIGTDLRGKVIGLIGMGRIGERVAHHLAKGFDSRVIYYDTRRNEQAEKEHSAEYRDTIESVLRDADIVSIHVPLLPTTRHLITAERLATMKPTAFLINTSRGPVVDEAALVDALRAKTIAGAGLDVFEFEPKLSSGLADFPNVVLTPHIASARTSARDAMSRIVAENIIDFFEGKTPRSIVNG